MFGKHPYARQIEWLFLRNHLLSILNHTKSVMTPLSNHYFRNATIKFHFFFALVVENMLLSNITILTKESIVSSNKRPSIRRKGEFHGQKHSKTCYMRFNPVAIPLSCARAKNGTRRGY